MNLFNLEYDVTLEEILKSVSEEQIFSYYMNIDVNFKKKYTNPFRDDTHPNCFFKVSKSGILYFVDYGYPDNSYLNAVEVVMMRYGCSYRKALSHIKTDLLCNFAANSKQIIQKTVINKEAFNTSSTEIKISLTKFKQSDVDYWESFGVTKETLKRYNVRKVDKVWINDRLWYLYNDLDPCYRYKEKNRFKLYRPLATKKNKFRSNLYGGILEGYTQLPDSGNTLIITKSSKDVMTLASLGFNAVAVRSESTPLSENAYNILKERFKKIFLWFDPDNAGVAGASKMSEKYNLPMFTHDISFGKDASDIYKNKGKTFLVKLIKDQLKK